MHSADWSAGCRTGVGHGGMVWTARVYYRTTGYDYQRTLQVGVQDGSIYVGRVSRDVGDGHGGQATPAGARLCFPGRHVGHNLFHHACHCQTSKML